MRKKLLHLVWMAVALAACSKKSNGGNGTGNEPPVDTTPVKTVTMWLTNADQSSLLQKQSSLLGFGTANASFGTVSLDSTIGFQSIDGFGYTLTGGSAQLINALPEAKQSVISVVGVNTRGTPSLALGVPSFQAFAYKRTRSK